MKKQAIGLFALCAVLFAGCGQEEAPEEKTLRTVETETVGKADIASGFSYSGKAAPSKEVSVVPTVPGKVINFNYDVGDTVREGAVLFTVDSTDLQNNLRSLEANYHVAELNLNNSKTTFENNQILYDEEIISQAEYDQIKLGYETAEANVTATQIQIDNLKKNISDCTVTSPMTGVIAQRGVERGGFASQAAPAYTVMDLSTIKVEVGVSEQVVNTIAIGDEVQVKMTAASAEPLTGRVSTISPSAGQTGTYTVKIELNNGDGLIKAGMLAEVSFTMEQSEGAFVLPRNAVLTKDGETYVYIMEGNTVKKTPVETGIETGETIEITSGLSEGMEVVTKGQTYVSDGEEVSVAGAARQADAENTEDAEAPDGQEATADDTEGKEE